MKIDVTEFKLREGEVVDLGFWARNVKPRYKSKKAYRKVLQDEVEQLSDQQRRRYASNRHALLLAFQAVDTAGKYGAIRLVMSGVNPQGCQVFGFAHPSTREHALAAARTTDLPWLIVPAGDKDNARLIVSQTALDALQGLQLRYPQVTTARRQAPKVIRQQLSK